MIKKILSLGILLFLVNGNIYAQDAVDQNATVPQGQQGSHPRTHHRPPSKASINACDNKSKGDACKMTSAQGTRSGVCTYTSDKKYLYCRHPHRKSHPKAKAQDQGSQSGTEEQGQNAKGE